MALDDPPTFEAPTPLVEDTTTKSISTLIDDQRSLQSFNKDIFGGGGTEYMSLADRLQKRNLIMTPSQVFHPAGGGLGLKEHGTYERRRKSYKKSKFHASSEHDTEVISNQRGL